MDGAVQSARGGEPDSGALSGGRQHSPGAGRADGSNVRPTGGRDADGAPRFDQPVAPGAYLWWYVDAISDDGQHALSIIAFVGSVFSPYYAWARRQGEADPGNHCSINVALYGKAGKRWTMTERSRASVQRSADRLVIGPSQLHWDGECLTIDIDEVCMPIPRRVRGRVRVHPQGLCRFVAALDDGGLHRWGPIAPCARVEAEFDSPGVSWSGHAYLDSNEGDEPIDRPFTEWDWSRAPLKDGSTGVIYDVRQKQGNDRVIAVRFQPSGEFEHFTPPERQPLPQTAWRIGRTMRTDERQRATVTQTLEDTPFYVRSVVASSLLGESVVSVHETLSVPRLVSTAVQLMLPWRMPRVR
jgi:carotenoid 1,2-hydratase